MFIKSMSFRAHLCLCAALLGLQLFAVSCLLRLQTADFALLIWSLPSLVN
jgi:hypothetical protein